MKIGLQLADKAVALAFQAAGLATDKIAEGLKAESVERYMRDMFDQHVAPNSWEDKVAIIRQFIAQKLGEPTPPDSD